jgi:hypothetical protein
MTATLTPSTVALGPHWRAELAGEVDRLGLYLIGYRLLGDAVNGWDSTGLTAAQLAVVFRQCDRATIRAAGRDLLRLADTVKP